MNSDLSKLLTPELHFVAACSYVPGTPKGFARQGHQLVEAISGGHNPDALWAAIRRHRIFALAERVLREHRMENVLGDRQGELKARARKVRLQNLRLLSASVQLAGHLSDAGIAHHFLKGPQLSQKIYGDAGLRHSKDLDLLIRPPQLAETVELLQARNWKLLDAGMWLNGGVCRRLAECRLRHLQMLHEQTGIGLELHWRIEAKPSPRLEQKWWDLWKDDSPGVTPPEFLHLCLHGAVHGWSRLKWLGDVAAIVDRQPDIWHVSEITCASLGLQLAASQTKLLLHALFGIEPGDQARENTSQVHSLARQAISEMKAADPNGKLSVGELWKRHHYQRGFESRYPFLDRLTSGLVLSLFHDNRILQRHPVLVAGMPLARIGNLVRRYVFTGDF